jgi:adenosylhomocysteine nucleosidase
MHEIVVFTALTWERRAVTAGVAGVEAGAQPRTWQGQLGDGGSCLVVQTGVGQTRARASALASPPARAFLACGCAGALSPSLHAGDLVVPDALVGFEPGGRPGLPVPVDGARLAAWGTARGFGVHVGAVVSSTVVLEDGRDKETAGAGGAIAVEMESLAVAAVAASRGIPFFGLRVVLDEAGQQLPFGRDVVDETTGELRPVRVFASLLDPRRWPAAGRLARQTQLAERGLRAVMTALLGVGGIASMLEPPVAARASRS